MAGTDRKSSAMRSGRLVGLLFVVFLVLKLTGVIGWSWWWVTAPLWIPVAGVLAILLALCGVGFMIFGAVRAYRKKRSTAPGQRVP